MSCTLNFDMVIEKDPADVLPYGIDWAAWLANEEADTILTSTWAINKTGLTNDSATFDTTSTTIWLSAGTLGEGYRVTNHIVTAGGREKEKTIQIVIKDQ